jgi:hypothetical protein
MEVDSTSHATYIAQTESGLGKMEELALQSEKKLYIYLVSDAAPLLIFRKRETDDDKPLCITVL